MASDIASTTPPTHPAPERVPEVDDPDTAGKGAVLAQPPGLAAQRTNHPQGSLARRMALIAAGWIAVLLLLGGIALDRTLTGLVTRNFDEQLEYMLTAMRGSGEI